MTRLELFYADQWACECPGVVGNLDQVAQQLAHGVKHGDGSWWVEPQRIPSTHAAVRIEYVYVPCPGVIDREYAIPEDLPGPPHAIAWGDGEGWGPEYLVTSRDHALELMREFGDKPIEYLVCCASETAGTLHLWEGPEATFSPTPSELAE
ncbi:hypothetical protein [Tritonibacter mobilis]|uniref:hypothetical protein n=1 Tax=Tritonibacter mobilis TaxID=379347 RepID=UPI000806B2B4|nr:hypothetical protein [Tritonibacter mobilis]